MTAVVSRPPVTVDRPLSPLERWYWIADQWSPLNVIARVRVTGPLPRPLLRQALDHLQARHPLLGAAIAAGADGADPRFVPCPAPIPLRHVRIAASAPDGRWVDEVNERELADRIDWRAGPLCRTTVLSDGNRHDLVLTLPHCIADGTTVLSLVKEWLLIAAGLRAGRPALPPQPALPACEELFPRSHRGLPGAARLKVIGLLDRRRLRRHRPGRVEPSRFVPFDRRRTTLVHRSLPAEQVDALLRACRRHGTTVHGALAAAMVIAVAQDKAADGAPDGAPAPPSHVAIGSPINFRGDLVPPVPDDAVGTYVATVPSIVPYRPGEPLWPAARAVSRDLTRRRRRGEHFGMVNLVGGACPATLAASEPFVEFIDRAGPVNLCISNIGRYGFPDRVGPWRLSGAQFVAGLSVCGHFVSTVNTSHGRLNWNFVYIDDALPDARAQRLVATCLDTVRAAIAAESRPPQTQTPPES